MIPEQVQHSLELLKMILGADLLGVYLYGSSVVGGLQKYSDIDLLAVVSRGTTLEEKEKLISSLLQISGRYMKSIKLPLEITLVEKAAVNPWQYPPCFDFQYGEWLRDSFEKGNHVPWDDKAMPDLALIITQVLLKSETLWGAKPEELLAPVPYPDFMEAMIQDLERLEGNLESDTRNVLLTFARIWSTLETNTIRSKPAAAHWVMTRLPQRYQPVMKRALSICEGGEKEYWEDMDELLKPCGDFMVNQINAQIALVDFQEPNKLITLYTS